MCDLVVSIAHNHLLPLLAEAANIMRRAPVEVEAMKMQLERVQDIIYKADTKASAEGDNLKRDEIKEMMKELIEASFEMEDVLDGYIVCEQQLQSRDPGCAAFNPEEVANFVRPMITRVQLAYKIQHLNSRVREIKERCQIHDGGSSFGGHQDPILRNLREEAPLYIKEGDVVGFEAPKAELIDWLVNGQEDRTVISVVGMGGQGKTTLARKVFESKEVVAHFDCHAWITVSQAFNVEALLRDMLGQFYKDTSVADILTTNRRSLKDEVRSYLRKKRYVIFLDDVWDTNLWDEIEYDMIDNIKGSRIFITTRKREVALHFKKSSIVKVHDLQLLDEKQSFELFCKKTFKSDFGGFCPAGLEDVSYEIVRKCEGLPLAIAVIGGVLSGKEPSEWIGFSKNLSSELENNPHLDSLTKILTSSYDDLISNLKSCLLYFGMYPEDFTIKSRRLINQWIAEGFIKQQKGKTLEKVAEGYLKELVERSLVQVSSFTIDGKAKSCRVHDMVREMILRKTEDLNFCQFNHEDDQSTLGGKIRRLSIATSPEALLGSIESPHLRSLIFFRNEESSECLVRRITPQCKLLKVLDFESSLFFRKTFPESILSLHHLKYLSLHGTALDRLPESIVKLENLEVLQLSRYGTSILPLPMEISKLRKLRYLRGRFQCFDDRNNCIGGLESLQTLKGLYIRSSKVALSNELGKVTHLRNLDLTLYGFGGEESVLLWDSINKMKHLEKLSLETQHNVFRHLHLFSPPPTLQKLRLIGRLNKLPKWISELPNLVKLTLEKSNLIDDPLQSLKKLPNLLSLILKRDCYKGESLHFQDGDFQKLKKLTLWDLESLNSIVIDEGALPSLKEFMLAEIPRLKTVPSGIQHLQKLERLALYGMPDELLARIARDGGQDHCIIKHVPSVNIFDHLSLKRRHWGLPFLRNSDSAPGLS